MPPRSGPWRGHPGPAPNAWEAMDHRKNPAHSATVPADQPVPASTSPYTAGETKWAAEVAESRNGISLKRSPRTL